MVGCTGSGIGAGAGTELGVSLTVTVDGAAVTVAGVLADDPQALNVSDAKTKAPKQISLIGTRVEYVNP